MGEIQRVVVIGDGGWGTTLALLLCKRGVKTTLWSAFPEHVVELREHRENRRYLPGVTLPETLEITGDAFEAARDAQLAISVVPTQYLSDVVERFEDALGGDVPVVTASKGLEIETLHTPSRILRGVLGERPLAVLSGPSHAEEVARGLPASVVVASEDRRFARRVQGLLSGESFRVYTHADPKGAELAGALKNVMAIAAGISDGLELGDNAKAALLTRGIVEMARYGQAHGAQIRTFFGLAGIGDLATTCYSKHSRNRHVGFEIGRGRKLEQILADMHMVAEGIGTTRALFGPESEARGIQMPIAEEVHAVLFDKKDPREAVTELMQRELGGEMDRLDTPFV